MKKTIVVTVLVFGATLVSCGKKPGQPSMEWTQKIATEMCEKMIECSAGMAEKIPADASEEMAAPEMPTKEQCVEGALKGFENLKKELNEEEVEAAKGCSEAIAMTDCTEIHNALGTPACQKFQEMASEKGE